MLSSPLISRSSSTHQDKSEYEIYIWHKHIKYKLSAIASRRDPLAIKILKTRAEYQKEET